MPKRPYDVRSSSSLAVKSKDYHQWKVVFSNKDLAFYLWGFTKFSRADYLKWKSENRIASDGVNAKLLGCHGPLAARRPGKAFLPAAVAETS
ncbi:hypothetical protein C4D60_Mb10t16920 [Musa balbisiana]|uniref:Uncharacterized protein n=1 Tax=Musa balbisiana TaxID=52838 RepID=A0A4S8J069_MUSBA|nr:hypothetical protein C4D60_Mb10t16920 [Musa balbisiana]